LQKKEYKIKFAYFLTRKKIKFAKEEYNVVRINNFETIIERIVLIKIIQKEIRFAQIQFKKTRKFAKKIKLERNVINALNSISLVKDKIKQHNILLM